MIKITDFILLLILLLSYELDKIEGVLKELLRTKALDDQPDSKQRILNFLQCLPIYLKDTQMKVNL